MTTKLRMALGTLTMLGMFGCGGQHGAVGYATTAAAADAPTRVVSTSIGNVVANAAGFTVYTYDPDTTSASTCYGECALDWPPVLVASSAVHDPLGTSARTDGSIQLTYRGHPVYLYVGDGASGATNGDGLSGIWHVVRP